MKALTPMAPIILQDGYMGKHPLILQEAVKRLVQRADCPALWDEVMARIGYSLIPSRIRRRAALRLLIECLARTDVASLMIGYPTPDGIISPSNNLLFSSGGMKQRTGERAMQMLTSARLVHIHKWPLGGRVRYTKRLDEDLFRMLNFEGQTVKNARSAIDCG